MTRDRLWRLSFHLAVLAAVAIVVARLLGHH